MLTEYKTERTRTDIEAVVLLTRSNRGTLHVETTLIRNLKTYYVIIILLRGIF